MSRFVITNLLIVFLITLFISAKANDNSVKDGTIDLSQYNWNTDVVNLEGEWDFYWRQLINPTNDNLSNHKKLAISVPGPWTKVKLNDSTKCTSEGFATYRLKIIIPNEDREYALQLYSIFTAYKLYVNSELKTTVGKIALIRDEAQPEFRPQIIPIKVEKFGDSATKTLEIILQTSNYHHRRAGIKDPIYFGEFSQIEYRYTSQLLITILLIGFVLVIGLNHLMMFALRRLDISNLAFSILAIIMILRIVTIGERLIIHIIPSISWEMVVKLDNLSGFGTMTLFAMFFHSLFPKEFPKRIYQFFIGLGILIAILVLFTNAWFYGQFRLLLELYVGLGGLYLTFGVLLVAAIRKRVGGLATFFGMFLLYSTAINDILNSMNILNSWDIAPYGIAIFVISQSYLITKRSAVALKNNNKLKDDLIKEKEMLQQRIEERTLKLKTQNENLNKFQEEQRNQIWISEHLNTIGIIMRNNKTNFTETIDALLIELLKTTTASIGAFYLITENDSLKLTSAFGIAGNIVDEIDPRHGILGRCFTEGTPKYITDLPNNFFNIGSGLGESKPRALAMIPLVVDKKHVGIIEIGSFKGFSSKYKSFLEQAISSIAAQINIIKLNDEAKQNKEKYMLRNQENEELKSNISSNLTEIETLRGMLDSK